MAYDFQKICQMVNEPERFVEQSNAVYMEHLKQAAEKIAKRAPIAPIVLLAGPSGSGKTTTANKIDHLLDGLGISTHTISMDDYYKSRSQMVPDKDGKIDLESPDCLDIDRLNEHFLQLAAREVVELPHFDFVTSTRNDKTGDLLQLHDNEVAIYEGIHALNPAVTGQIGQHATKVYISARSNIVDGEKIIFKGTWMRFIRRLVRDYRFRGTDPKATMQMWANIRHGEKKYISPYKEDSDIIFDSSFPYEVCLLKDFALPLMEEIPECERTREIHELRENLKRFPSLDEKYVPTNAMLREFIGGGIY